MAAHLQRPVKCNFQEVAPSPYVQKLVNEFWTNRPRSAGVLGGQLLAVMCSATVTAKCHDTLSDQTRFRTELLY